MEYNTLITTLYIQIIKFIPSDIDIKSIEKKRRKGKGKQYNKNKNKISH